MKTLCIIGLIVVLLFIFLGAIPVIVGLGQLDEFGEHYALGLITSVIILVVIVSSVVINFYFNPEAFGYQKIVSENCVESED